MIHSFDDLARALEQRGVRFVLIGVAGANYYGPGPAAMFSTKDHDLFLPLDAENLMRAWETCEESGLELTCAGEPLDRPHDLWLARRIVDQCALTRASDGEDLLIDLTFVMSAHTFEDVWTKRRTFGGGGFTLSVARLRDIIASKANAGRLKDRLFLETHREQLRELMRSEAVENEG